MPLPTEHLHDTKTCEDLLNDGKSGAFEVLGGLPAPAQVSERTRGDEIDCGSNSEGDKGELPVDPSCDIDDPDECETSTHQWDEAPDRNPLDRVCIVLNAVDGISRASRVVIGEGKSLDVTEEPSTEE